MTSTLGSTSSAAGACTVSSSLSFVLWACQKPRATSRAIKMPMANAVIAPIRAI